MELTEAIRARSSVRAFLDQPVTREQVEAVMDTARWSPSGVNMQPWRVEVVTGASKQRIGEAILSARAGGQAENPDYSYYPAEWSEPYAGRRKASGIALYQALGIGREDADKRIAARNRNYLFFGAPVGLLFFLERRLGQGAWLDIGIFLQSVMLAATSQGLATCPQAALAEYPDIVRDVVDVSDDYLLVCGMALGYPDPAAPVNSYRTERAPVSAFTRWHG